MPLVNSPTFKNVESKMLEIPQPGIKGLNLNDLEYEQDVNQSPYMLNMMYKNGVFCKRYGQEIDENNVYDDDIKAFVYFNDKLIIHAGQDIYIDGVKVANGISDKAGMFVKFRQSLYYFCDYEIYEYKYDEDTWLWETLEPYIPIITINRRPNGTSGDSIEPYNMIGTGFQNNFHGDGSSVDYYLTDKNLDSGGNSIPKVTIDNEKWTYDPNLSAAKTFKIDYELGKVTLKSAAPSGTNNVEIIAYKHDDEWTSYHDQITNSKCYACFGGNNNSRLFVAGGGKSFYYYSEVFDASYFPYTNYARVGNSVEDIVCFGQQYNVLLVFKPREIYSLTYYQASSDTTTSESQVGIGMFSSQIVNSSIGCDCPYSIQLVNNQLTWFNSREGVCTLVSTNVIDERNVRVLSSNINRTNNLGVVGILDFNVNLDEIKSADFNNKYFLSFPNGKCFVWDYEISPYVVTSSKVTNAKDLAWFLFDNFYVGDFLNVGDHLCIRSNHSNFTKKLIKLTNNLTDLDFNNDGLNDPIVSYYMTSLNQFEAVEYLKTIKNIYVQCRGDKPTTINLKYITEDNPNGEEEPEPIRIFSNIFNGFTWENFGWEVLNFANTFRRKCSIKKVQVLGIKFYNNEKNSDMSISHLAMQYQVVKTIK